MSLYSFIMGGAGWEYDLVNNKEMQANLATRKEEDKKRESENEGSVEMTGELGSTQHRA